MNRTDRNELDPTLKSQLENYAAGAPNRDPAAEKHTRDRFMTELNIMTGDEPVVNQPSRSLLSTLITWATGLNQPKEILTMSISQRSSMTIAASILVLAVFLFGGGGITAYAASGSLPGDALYPIKTSLEKVRADLTSDDAVKARLFLDFAGRRLDEVKSLIADGRFNHVSNTAKQFENDIHQALEAIQKLAQQDPAQAAVLNAEAFKIIAGYADTLTNLLTTAPIQVQPIIKDAIDASQSALSGNVNSNSNDNNSNINDDDSNGNSNENDSNINNDVGNENGNDDMINANTNDDNGIDYSNIYDDDYGIDNSNISDDHGGISDSNTNDNTSTSGGNGNNDNSSGNSGDDNSGGGGGGGDDNTNNHG